MIKTEEQEIGTIKNYVNRNVIPQHIEVHR